MNSIFAVFVVFCSWVGGVGEVDATTICGKIGFSCDLCLCVNLILIVCADKEAYLRRPSILGEIEKGQLSKGTENSLDLISFALK